jgi:hypothetical protein
MISGEFVSDLKMVMLSKLKSAITIKEVRYMTINNTGMNRKPTHPGEMLREGRYCTIGVAASSPAHVVG